MPTKAQQTSAIGATTPFRVFMSLANATRPPANIAANAITVQLAKDGEAFASVTPTISATSAAGWYLVTPSAEHRSAYGLQTWKFSASGCNVSTVTEFVSLTLPSLETELADAVALYLSSVVLPEEVQTIERRFLPRFELTELEQVRVVVAPVTREKRSVNRNSAQRDYFVQIGILQRLKQKPAERDQRIAELLRLTEAIDDALETAGQLAGCTWSESSARPLFDPDQLDSGCFRAVLQIKFTIAGRPAPATPKQ